MASQSIIRISREINQIQAGGDLSLAVAVREDNIRDVRALIIGPAETPYEFGFFEFAIKFTKDYPSGPPDVTCITTNGGKTRFNPNIYATGKVCLSILGTWRGEPGEQWSSAQGLESILISIQSLMSSNPYENEPGFENARSESDKQSMRQYASKIRHESLRISVIQRLEEYLGIQADGTVLPPSFPGPLNDDIPEEDLLMLEDERPVFDYFNDLCKRRFLWYYEAYLSAIDKAEREVKNGDTFTQMPFEGGGNGMTGRFQYPKLRSRLERIKEVIDAETARWAQEGEAARDKGLSISVNLRRQFEQFSEHNIKVGNFSGELTLTNDNPFVWHISYFGRPATKLDGGMFQIEVKISVRFPEEQPRIIVQTPIYHHRVSREGVLCYQLKKGDRPEDLRAHVAGIIEALEDENPRYDPRTVVHGEATKLLFGTPEQKKMYNRKLRRSVEASLEM